MSQKIITEADIIKMEPHHEVVLDWDTIITPAAMDAAYAKGVHIIDLREGRRPRGRGAGNPQMQGWGKIGRLSDGDYLLQIRDGKPKLFRIEDDGVSPVL